MNNKESIIDTIKREITGIKTDAKVAHTGRVTKLADGVVTVSGLGNAQYNEMLDFIDGKGMIIQGVALNLEEDSVGAILLGDGAHIKEGCVVNSTGRILSVNVDDSVIGRVLGGLGTSKDGGPEINSKDTKAYPLEKIAP